MRILRWMIELKNCIKIENIRGKLEISPIENKMRETR